MESVAAVRKEGALLVSGDENEVIEGDGWCRLVLGSGLKQLRKPQNKSQERLEKEVVRLYIKGKMPTQSHLWLFP